MPCADHSDVHGRKQIDAPPAKQHRRRIEDSPQQFRITGIAQRDQLSPAIANQLLLRRGIFKAAAARNRPRQRSRHSRILQFGGRRMENRPHPAKAFEQNGGPPGPESRHHPKRQPVEFFFVRRCAVEGVG